LLRRGVGQGGRTASFIEHWLLCRDLPWWVILAGSAAFARLVVGSAPAGSDAMTFEQNP
jgi:hypothetical protein